MDLININLKNKIKQLEYEIGVLQEKKKKLLEELRLQCNHQSHIIERKYISKDQTNLAYMVYNRICLGCDSLLESRKFEYGYKNDK